MLEGYFVFKYIMEYKYVYIVKVYNFFFKKFMNNF